MPDEGLRFEGWPSTSVFPSKKEIKVVARYQTPERTKLIQSLRGLGLLGIVGYFLYFYRWFLLQTPFESSYPYIEFLSYAGPWYLLARFVLPFLVGVKVTVIFNQDLIKIKTPWRRWRKVSRREDHSFGYDLTEFTDQFRYHLNHVQGFFPFPNIVGHEKLAQLHNRLGTIDQLMNTWHPEEWGPLAVDRWNYADLKRSDWPMSKNEQKTYLLREPFWLLLGYSAGGLALLSLAYLSFFFLHRFVQGWTFVIPDGVLGESDYGWFIFLGASFVVLLLLLGRRFYDFISLLRFLGRSGRVEGHDQKWELEPGGYVRLSVGVLHGVVSFLIAMPLMYGGMVYGIEFVNAEMMSVSKVLRGEGGLLVSGILGGCAGVAIIFLATEIKAVLDFLWRVAFQGREMGIRDLIIYFHEHDEAV